MNMFIEVTTEAGYKTMINKNCIVSFWPCDNTRHKCGIETTSHSNQEFLSVKESYEEVKKMIGETA